MNREDIIALTLAKLDEIGALANSEAFSPYSVIDALMDESAVNMIRNAPLQMLKPEKVNVNGANFIHVKQEDGTGFIVLPANFVRLYSFKMKSWKRPADKAISIENQQYKLQANTVTRGKPNKPVVAINYFNDGEGIDNPNPGIDPPVDGWSAVPPIYIDEQTIYHGNNAGQRHIPVGGELNQMLVFAPPSGNAAWSYMSDAIHGNRGGGSLHNIANAFVHGFMSSQDKLKLDTVQYGANYYVHPDTQGNRHIPRGGLLGDILTWSMAGTARWIDPLTFLEPLLQLGQANEFYSWDKTWRRVDYSMITNTPQIPEEIQPGQVNEFYSWDKTWRQIDYDMISNTPTIPAPADLSNYVTLSGAEQTITSIKTFNSAHGINIRTNNGNAPFTPYGDAFNIRTNNKASEETIYTGILSIATLSEGRSWTLPNKTGTIAMTSDIPTQVTQLTAGVKKMFYSDQNGAIQEFNLSVGVGNILVSGNFGFPVWLNQNSWIKAGTGLNISNTFGENDIVINHNNTSGWRHIPSGGSSGQILIWSADGTAAWGSSSSGASALSELTDVQISSLQTGQVLQYNGTKWVNATVSGTAHDRLHNMTNSLDHNMNSGHIIGRTSSGAGAPEELTSANVMSFLGITEADWKNENINKAQIEAKLTGNITTHTHSYDNYVSWLISVSGTPGTYAVASGNEITFSGSGGTTVSRSGNVITINSSTASGGIPEIPSGTNTSYMRSRDANGNSIWSLYTAPSTHPAVSLTVLQSAGFLSLNAQTQQLTVNKIHRSDLNTAGVPTEETFLRGDYVWATPPGGVYYFFSVSLTKNDSNVVMLVNDNLTPGANKYYGTNISGTKGWFSLPTGGLADETDPFFNAWIDSEPFTMLFSSGVITFDLFDSSGTLKLRRTVNLDSRYFTELEIENMFAGNTSVNGYNKTNWDSAYSWVTSNSNAFVPKTSTITINGTTFDLTQNRTWNVGTITGIIAGNGVSVTGSSTNPTISVVASTPSSGTLGRIIVSSSGIGVELGNTSTTAASGNHTHAQLHDRVHSILSVADHTAPANSIFYSDESGAINARTLGSNKQLLISNGEGFGVSFVDLSSLDVFGTNKKGLVPAASGFSGAQQRFLSESGEWLVPAGSGSGMVNPMTTAGDMIIMSSGLSPVRLGIGSQGQVLTVNSSGMPQWLSGSGGFVIQLTGDVTTPQGSQVTTLQAQAIANRTAITSLAGTEEWLINQGGTLRKITSENLRKYAHSFGVKGQFVYADSSLNPALLAPPIIDNKNYWLMQNNRNPFYAEALIGNLSDVASYSNQANKLLIVNDNATGITYTGIDTTRLLRLSGGQLQARLQNETTPVLGGNLDVSGNNLNSVKNIAGILASGNPDSLLGTQQLPFKEVHSVMMRPQGFIYFGQNNTYYIDGLGNAILNTLQVNSFTMNEVQLGNWKISTSGTSLIFRYNNTTKAELLNNGNLKLMM